MLLHVIRDVGVVTSASAHEHLIDVARGISSVMVDDGMGSDTSDSSNDIVGSQSAGDTLLAQIFSHIVAEGLATGGLGDVVRKVGVCEDLVEEVFVDFAGFAHFTVFVVFLLTVGEVTDRTVDEDVSWTSVEVVACSDTAELVVGNEAHLKSASSRGRERGAYISDTTDVLASADLGGMVQEQRIQEGNKRTSLSSVSLVSNTELRDGGLSGAGGDDGGLSHVEMCSELVALEHLRERKMPDGNSVRSDKIDILLDVNAVFLAELEGRSGELFSEEVVYLGDFFGGAVVLSDCLHDSLLQLQRHGN